MDYSGSPTSAHSPKISRNLLFLLTSSSFARGYKQPAHPKRAAKYQVLKTRRDRRSSRCWGHRRPHESGSPVANTTTYSNWTPSDSRSGAVYVEQQKSLFCLRHQLLLFLLLLVKKDLEVKECESERRDGGERNAAATAVQAHLSLFSCCISCLLTHNSIAFFLEATTVRFLSDVSFGFSVLVCQT